MSDTNRPSYWQVIDTRTMKVVDDNLTHGAAIARCEYLEPEPEVTGFRFTIQLVRSHD